MGILKVFKAFVFGCCWLCHSCSNYHNISSDKLLLSTENTKFSVLSKTHESLTCEPTQSRGILMKVVNLYIVLNF